MMWLPSPGKESAQTHECLAHFPWSMNSNDKVEFTKPGVRFGGFFRVIREHDDFKSAAILLF